MRYTPELAIHVSSSVRSKACTDRTYRKAEPNWKQFNHVSAGAQLGPSEGRSLYKREGNTMQCLKIMYLEMIIVSFRSREILREVPGFRYFRVLKKL